MAALLIKKNLSSDCLAFSTGMGAITSHLLQNKIKILLLGFTKVIIIIIIIKIIIIIIEALAAYLSWLVVLWVIMVIQLDNKG